ncbi:MAG: aminotransferase class I/II-fold pyridoxal phosphate-dependent enzyme [Bdellovibrionales bacterium]|nr:aminotransferase class I/II-fold pyridoxal phosphate-dependent enzyme [Bdellovibrionales bacterium]
MIKRPQHVQSLRPYQAGKTIEEASRNGHCTSFVKLASNENPLSCSPIVRKVLNEFDLHLHLYPEKRDPELLEAMAHHLGVPSSRLMFTAGIDALLSYILIAFSQEGDEIVTSKGSFIGLYVNARKLGRTVKTVPLKEWTFDGDAILEACSDQTKIIYIANANNPTSTAWTKTQWDEFRRKVPDDIVIILDEAYFEYSSVYEDYPDGVHCFQDNVIVCRTFSKAYGLAGMRIGYAYAHEDLVEDLMKVRLPFEPTYTARVAAKAALSDQKFIKEVLEENQRGLEFFEKEFSRLGISYVPHSRTNFLMLLFENEILADNIAERALEKGLIVRPLAAFGFPKAIRMNTGTKEQNQFAIDVLENIILGKETI